MIFVFFWDGIFSGIRCLSLKFVLVFVGFVLLLRHAVNAKRLGEVEQQRAKRQHAEKKE